MLAKLISDFDLRTNVSSAEFNSFRTGGAVEFLYLPKDVLELCDFLQKLPIDVPVTWVGLGSNILIRDSGLSGVVIVTQCLTSGPHETADAGIIYAEAGVSCAKLARMSARLGWSGIEFMAGIPGTVGGALAMNAGCNGGETWQKVIEVQMINRLGCILKRKPIDFKIDYRSVEKSNDEWFISGCFKLEQGKKTTSLANIKSLLAKRSASQPTGLPNCGSVFRNPEGDFAARLIELCGLKGFKIGGAVVSTKHANFIINTGVALSKDIENLIEHIKETVMIKTGVHLVPEVKILGAL